MLKKRSGAVALAAIAATFAAGTLALADRYGSAVEYPATDGSTYTSLRPTGIGLPQIGVTGTVGAGELHPALRKYHDSGVYERDIRTVVNSAKAYLDKRLDSDAAKAKKVKTCKTSYRRIRTGTKRGLYRRVRSCRTKSVAPERIEGKAAIVLDIDETSLSNYQGLAATNFSTIGNAIQPALGTGSAIAPTVELYKLARSRGVAVFFITGRPSLIKSPTESNLRAAGYTTWDGLQFKPSGPTTKAYKSGARADLEKKGYDIVANVGDQESDLDGGHADRAFKLPNPFYFISD
jgi:hypothetical protein